MRANQRAGFVTVGAAVSKRKPDGIGLAVPPAGSIHLFGEFSRRPPSRLSPVDVLYRVGWDRPYTRGGFDAQDHRLIRRWDLDDAAHPGARASSGMFRGVTRGSPSCGNSNGVGVSNRNTSSLRSAAVEIRLNRIQESFFCGL